MRFDWAERFAKQNGASGQYGKLGSLPCFHTTTLEYENERQFVSQLSKPPKFAPKWVHIYLNGNPYLLLPITW